LRLETEQGTAIAHGNVQQHKLLTLAVLKQFRLIYGSVRQHFRQIEDICGVSGSQLWMLHELQAAPGIGVSDLAHRLSIHQTTCSQLVEKLVARGYVIKTRSVEDQRRVGLSITSRASKVLKEAPGPAEGLLPEALLRLSDATLQSLTAHLGKLIDGLHLQDERAANRPLSDL
jgi:DNA-binding MarR family transcriptional regulator